ncbi:MAG: hypothetical protein OXG35_05155 [Acidobacteria bacterium]|nr:hypothetical protein [Acidobacteriota bacterium]
MRFRTLVGGCLVSLLAASAPLDAAPAGEPQRRPVPRPFPRPGQSEPARDEARAGVEDPRPAQAPVAPAATPAGAAEAAPTEAMLGFPVSPAAQFITSYDAGRQQRYYLYGTNSEFEAMVRYYRNVLRERGNRVFDDPPTHIFEVGRFREREMAFPPSVTIKDYAWNGAEGYLVPAGGEPARFRTIIQIVPSPPQSRR